MALQRTLSILKPDATRRNLTGAINAVFIKSDAGAFLLFDRISATGFSAGFRCRCFAARSRDDFRLHFAFHHFDAGRTCDDLEFGTAIETMFFIRTFDAIGTLIQDDAFTVSDGPDPVGIDSLAH